MERSSVSEKMLSNERVDVKKQAYITPAFSNLDKNLINLSFNLNSL